MKVKEIMTKEPVTCSPDTTVAEAAHLMWEADCGILPVVDDGEIEGVVTAPEDDVREVLALMKQALVRRVPVVGFGGTVLGIVSMNDIVLAADMDESLLGEDALDALKAICGHHHAAPHVVPA